MLQTPKVCISTQKSLPSLGGSWLIYKSTNSNSYVSCIFCLHIQISLSPSSWCFLPEEADLLGSLGSHVFFLLVRFSQRERHREAIRRQRVREKLQYLSSLPLFAGLQSGWRCIPVWNATTPLKWLFYNFLLQSNGTFRSKGLLSVACSMYCPLLVPLNLVTSWYGPLIEWALTPIEYTLS